ncbi:MAG: CHAD domain-containing protein [Gaiellaceae bacterium]
MRATLERELKLDVDGPFVLPGLPGEELAARVFTSTYHDTPVRSLGRAGITLRRRLENGKSLWQLKLPRTGNGNVRAEIEEPGGPAGPPKSLARLLEAHLRHGPLEPVATLRTHRSGVRVRDGERPVADITLDAVDILDAGRSAGGFTEIEIELVDGDDDDLRRLGRLLRDAGARKSSGAPKLMRVIELPESAAPPKDAPLLSQLRHYFGAQLSELEARDPGVRLGTHPEDVHRFRVATRRTRALIRATKPLLGDSLVTLGEELRWLAGVLGPVRDLDVLLEHLRQEVAGLDVDEEAGHELLRGLSAEYELRRVELLAALGAPRYASLLETFEEAIALIHPREVGGAANAIARDALRKLRRAAAKLPDDPSDEALHGLRIEAKRARYAAELAALGGSKAAAGTVEAFKRVQDVIGEHQDAVVAEARLRRLARAKTAVAAGRLIERERGRKFAMRRDYPAAVAAALREGRKAFG